MDTKPIFDFILEIKYRKQYRFPANFSHDSRRNISACFHKYFTLLSKMEEEFEACVFQCVAENPMFKEELHIVADKIGNMVYDWKYKQSIKKLGKSPYGDSKRVAIQVGEKSLQFLKDNYGIITKAVPNPVLESKSKDEIKEEVKKTGESSFLNGKEVASLFGLAYNNIKDKKWRDKNTFPYLQPTGDRGKVVYVKEDVEEWMKNNGNRG